MYFYSHCCLDEVVVVCVYVKMKVLVEPVIEQTQQLSSNMSLNAKGPALTATKQFCVTQKDNQLLFFFFNSKEQNV